MYRSIRSRARGYARLITQYLESHKIDKALPYHLFCSDVWGCNFNYIGGFLTYEEAEHYPFKGDKNILILSE